MVEPDDDYHREISEALAEELLKMMPGEAEELSVLIVGLGNREVTADALGPQVVDNLLITRHVVRAYGKAAYNCTRMNLVSSIEPGVMAKTGMETAEIISGVVKETQPDVLIVVDALAARSPRRLCRTVQLSDTGLIPGSGVGNARMALDEEHLGIPVIAVGVPTVVEAATLCLDLLDQAGQEGFDPALFRQEGAEWFVTPRNVDSEVETLSRVLGLGISTALHVDFSVEDVEKWIS